MSSRNNCTSDKLNVIDKKTFECIQRHQNTVSIGQFRKIHNAKYRKKSATSGRNCSTFNLMQFLTKTTKQNQNKLRSRTFCKTGCRADKTWRKRGKTREGGKRKKWSRLKKAILRYRDQKTRMETNTVDSSELLKETVEKISTLTIDSKDCKKDEERVNSNQQDSKNLHSRRFRSYCDNCTTPLLAELSEKFLRELDRFHKRAISQNAIKAHAHRRFVVGFREAQCFLLVKKVKLIIIAPDCEICDGADGLDAKISNIKNQCQQQNIPYLFALRRRQLAYALFKKAPVSCVAVLDYDGAREIYSSLLEALQKARQAYEELTSTHPFDP